MGLFIRCVVSASIQYENFRFGSEPAVTAGSVRSAVEIEQMVSGLVIITVGGPGRAFISTLAEEAEVQPTALVTVNVYVPGSRPETVLELPEPLIITPSG